MIDRTNRITHLGHTKTDEADPLPASLALAIIELKDSQPVYEAWALPGLSRDGLQSVIAKVKHALAPASPVQNMLHWALGELLGALPERRDWFNPDAEKVLRAVHSGPRIAGADLDLRDLGHLFAESQETGRPVTLSASACGVLLDAMMTSTPAATTASMDHCTACNGSRLGHKSKDCEACDGTGRAWAQTEKAAELAAIEATTASAAGDDQQFDRNAERITREMGLGLGSINPNATSVLDLFMDEPGWAECERISNLPGVDEALRGFSDDPTGDNGVCVVRAILAATGSAALRAIDGDVTRESALAAIEHVEAHNGPGRSAEARAMLATPLDRPTCPDCGTHEVELSRTCHNSACASYATPVTTYEGWKQPATGSAA